MKAFEEHSNPFSHDDSGLLRNLFSGAVIEEDYCESIVNVIEKGRESLNRFTAERLVEGCTKSLWATVSRNKIETFTSVLSKKGKKEVQRKMHQTRTQLVGKVSGFETFVKRYQ